MSKGKKTSIQRILKLEVRKHLKKHDNDKTAKQYRKDLDKYCDYCWSQGARSFEAYSRFVQGYICWLQGQGKSASTIHTYIAPICEALKVDMKTLDKPQRHVSEYKRGRKPPTKCTTDRDLDAEENKHLVDFQRAARIRRTELGHLYGRDLVQDESGYLCVLVEKGKGGKRQLQRIDADKVDFVKSYFEEKKPDERIFSVSEMNNRLNLHWIRAKGSQDYYAKCLRRLHSEPGYRAQLEAEIRLRWR